jgi:hypothetical protein
MLPALGMGQIGAIILVNSETEAAFEGSDMVLEKIGVFVEVDGFEGEFSQTLSPIGVRC